MEVKVRHTLQMGHRLHNIPGKCQNLHGHTWAVTLGLKLLTTCYQDIVVNYHEIKEKWVKWLDEEFDHKLVLDIKDSLLSYVDGPETNVRYPGLRMVNFVPTVENLARYWMAEAQAIFGPTYQYTVEVWEGETNSAVTSTE